ncbi:MAG: LCP family protein [Nitriliruptorales bacterium]
MSAREWRRGRVFAVVGCVLLVAVAGTALGLWRYADGRIRHQTIPVLARPEDVPPPLKGTVNVLAVGTDSREGLSEAELRDIGTEEVYGERADTIILIHLSPERPDAVMVSFPRDLKVQIPGHGTNKLNASLAYGGPDLLVETIEDYSGIHIDHYVQVNIAGFLELVEVVGGVQVCLDRPLVDPHAGANLPAGCHSLRSADAAAYVRARHTPPGGDLGRIERQQRFLRAAMEKVISAGTFVNPLRMKRLIDAASNAVVTDNGFGTTEMARLAWSLRSLEPEEVDMRTLPGRERRQDGVYYFVGDPAGAESLFQSIRDGETLPNRSGTNATPVETASPAVTDPVPPAAVPPRNSDVVVRVVNAAGISGLAAQARSELETAGFTVRSVGNSRRFGLRLTVIRYSPGAKAKADLVAVLFPGARLESASRDGDTAGADVVVLLGADWAKRKQA